MQLFKISIAQVIYLLLFAIPNTLLSFGIIYIINNALARNEAFLKDYMGIVFFALICYTYLLNIIFQKQLNLYSFKILYNNEKILFEKFLKTPLSVFEKLGSQRFFTTVEDLRIFAFLPYTVTHTVNSILMVILCLVYMFTLSTVAAFIVVGLIILVAGCYFIVMNSMSKQLEQLREYNDQYYKYVDDVIKGFEELKLGFFKRQNLMNRFLVPNRNEAEKLDFKINYVFLSINMISQYGLYFVMAVILFLLPQWGYLNQADVIAYLVIILFISGPINNLINLQQMYTRFIVADKRIKSFIKDFQNEDVEPELTPASDAGFKSLEFQGACYAYGAESEEKSFSLGPVDLKIEQGEILFIIGGNGSGKSTFIKTLTGLYESSKGNILLNGKQIQFKEEVQSLIAAVFTNNHLFSHNYEGVELENNPEYKRLLKIMQLDQVVLDDSDAEARRKFSKGQSKRMSLIFALLEKKPILVLDEWAADQDPYFRKYFYEELIPKLKEEGKTIIAVTHDDTYFHQADRIIKFDYGKIVKDVQVSNKALLKEVYWA